MWPQIQTHVWEALLFNPETHVHIWKTVLFPGKHRYRNLVSSKFLPLYAKPSEVFAPLESSLGIDLRTVKAVIVAERLMVCCGGWRGVVMMAGCVRKISLLREWGWWEEEGWRHKQTRRNKRDRLASQIGVDRIIQLKGFQWRRRGECCRWVISCMALFQPPALFAWAHACVITVALFVCTNVDIVSCCLLWVWVFGKLTSVSFDFGFLLLRLFCNFNSTGVFLGVAKRKLVLDAPSASVFVVLESIWGSFLRNAKCPFTL